MSDENYPYLDPLHEVKYGAERTAGAVDVLLHLVLVVLLAQAQQGVQVQVQVHLVLPRVI